MQNYQVTPYQGNHEQEISQRAQHLVDSLKDLWNRPHTPSREDWTLRTKPCRICRAGSTLDLFTAKGVYAPARPGTHVCTSPNALYGDGSCCGCAVHNGTVAGNISIRSLSFTTRGRTSTYNYKHWFTANTHYRLKYAGFVNNISRIMVGRSR